jgi:MFS family permease
MGQASRIFYIRQLDSYPLGRRRLFLLFVAVLATLIASYEAQIAPVLPLIMRDIGMTKEQYGWIVAATVVFSAVGAMLFGPVCDRLGRTAVLVPALFATGACVFAMTLVTSLTLLFTVRATLGFVEGAVVAASAGLVRDFSPRMGRALAYGFWTFGPVGSSLMAASIAGNTLALFDDQWQSQFYIAGVISIVVAVFVMFTIHDLSPSVRHQIMHREDEVQLQGVDSRETAARRRPGVRVAMGQWRIWWMVGGITLFLMLYFVLQQFGPLILVETYGFKADEAAYMSQFFWALNLVTLLGAGWISDRLQLRKIVSFTGALLTIPVMIAWIALAGTHPSSITMILLMSLLGGMFGITYAPWMAWFSETLEDISTAIQASGWAMWAFVGRVYVVCTVIPMTVISQRYGWQPWLWITVGGVVIYTACILFSRTPWLHRELPGVSARGHAYVPQTIAD